MRGRRSIFALLVLVSAACVDSANLGIELENGLFFVLTLDEEGQLVGLPDGPYRGATELPPAFAIPPGHERQLLQLDEDRTRTSFPAYFARDLSEVSLVRASSELELCSEFGLLEEERRLLVPLEALAEAILVWPLEQGAAAEQQALPEGLALRFEARACQRGPRAILRPFGESEHIMPSSMRGALGRVHTLVPLGDDTLLAVGFSAVVRLRRGQAPDLSRDFLDVTSTLPLAPDPYSWAVRTAAASSEGVLLLADQRPDTSDRTNRLNEGAAVIWLTARPDSPLVLGEPLLLATPPKPRRSGSSTCSSRRPAATSPWVSIRCSPPRARLRGPDYSPRRGSKARGSFHSVNSTPRCWFWPTGDRCSKGIYSWASTRSEPTRSRRPT